MPKPDLREPYRTLEREVAETMKAGLQEWRAGRYPQSYSDMQACIRAVLRMYDVKRRPIALGRTEIEEER